MSPFKRLSQEEEFWIWFQKNENSLFNFERDQERIFRELQTALHEVNPKLTFEFSNIVNNRREFVISADGIKSAFPAVESLFKSAPVLPRWVFIKFRPRREPCDIMMVDVKVGHEDVEIAMGPDGDKIGLNVFVKGFNQEKSNQYSQLAFILLDHVIGEYDMETKVGFIEIRPFEETSPGKRYNIRIFPAMFDEFARRQNYKDN